MSSEEFTHWIAYYNLEPFGQDRDNLHAGIIASAIINVFARRGKSVSPQDFMLVDRHTQKKTKLGAFSNWVKSVAKKKR